MVLESGKWRGNAIRVVLCLDLRKREAGDSLLGKCEICLPRRRFEGKMKKFEREDIWTWKWWDDD